jgi:methylated-DNA-[protein]-cysteine S-methyltransferase
MNESLRLLLDHIETPVGVLALVADEEGRLRAVGWTDRHARMERELGSASGPAGVVMTRASNPGGFSAAMRAYFAGDLNAIRDLPVSLEGTPFQRAVWGALREIPAGETCSYGELARRIGRSTAVRAVGLANGANPIAIVVPCHRVIGADGTLTGYGGGMERKRWLLAHERCAGRERQLDLPHAFGSNALRPEPIRPRAPRLGSIAS